MKALTDIAGRHSLLLVEDCCESLGSSFSERPVGSFGALGTFSFYFSHHITTLEGGMCVTDSHHLAEVMRILRSHGWVRDTQDRENYSKTYPDIHPNFLFVNLGYNLRPTELQGGFGIWQLKKLQSFIDIRRDNAQFWRRELGRYAQYFEIQKETPSGYHTWFGFPMAVKETAPFSAGDLTSFLNQRGIETRPLVAGNIAKQPALKYFAHRVVGTLSHSTHLMQRGFTFGNHQAVNNQARSYIVQTIQEFLDRRGLL
jgi:CDP-6-deoxy-D-xylo-4-hexulose-3-dehydrase